MVSFIRKKINTKIHSFSKLLLLEFLLSRFFILAILHPHHHRNFSRRKKNCIHLFHFLMDFQKIKEMTNDRNIDIYRDTFLRRIIEGTLETEKTQFVAQYLPKETQRREEKAKKILFTSQIMTRPRKEKAPPPLYCSSHFPAFFSSIGETISLLPRERQRKRKFQF